MELKFKADTKQRKEWFTGVSFSHPGAEYDRREE